MRQGVRGASYHHVQDAVRGRHREAACHRFSRGPRIRPVRIETRFVYQVVRTARCRRHHARGVVRPLDIDGQLGDALVTVRVLHGVPDVIALVEGRRQRLGRRTAVVQRISPAAIAVLHEVAVGRQRGDCRTVVVPGSAPAHEGRRGVCPHGVVAQHVAVQAARHVFSDRTTQLISGLGHIVFDMDQEAAGQGASAACGLQDAGEIQGQQFVVIAITQRMIQRLDQVELIAAI